MPQMHAAQPHNQQIEGYQQPYQQLAPVHQVMIDREPGRQQFAHEFAIRQAEAKTQFAQVMQRIYSDTSIAKAIKQKYPGLTVQQLRKHTQDEKEAKMNAVGVAFLHEQLPEISLGEIQAQAETYKKDFFNTYIMDRVDKACCCTYPYDREGYKYLGNEQGTQYGKWRHDTRYCCILDCFCCCFSSCKE